MGNPPGNIDQGAAWGSYIGLFFLAVSFVAIGVFASSLTDNTIIAFITGVFLCFITYAGFQSIAALAVFSSFQNILLYLGIEDHYTSMSRGVVDTRDVLYFFSISALFILFTRVKLESRKWQ